MRASDHLGRSMANELRRRIMKANGPRDTKPELALRKRLHAAGLRYRVADRRLPGSPDLVFPRWKTAIFVNGCYWHHHPGCRRATLPKTNTEFWVRKFDANRERDRRNVREVIALGWRVGVAWECVNASDIAPLVASFVKGHHPVYTEWPDPCERGGMGLFAPEEMPSSHGT
ncbi:MAG: very short patch repair endonuclease [Pseudomonadota bacterium]